MNEKIKEIMYKVDDINILNEVGMDADFLADIDWQRLEKLAEMVVKECAKLCDKDYERCGQDGAGWRLARMIEEHFGVE